MTFFFNEPLTQIIEVTFWLAISLLKAISIDLFRITHSSEFSTVVGGEGRESESAISFVWIEGYLAAARLIAS